MLEVLTADQCLQNHQFQDWMAGTDAMPRVAVDHDDLTKRSRSSMWPGHLSDKFLKLATSNTGYILSNQELSTELYGNPNQLHKIDNIGNHVRHTIRNPEAVVHFPGIGWAIGVKDFSLTRLSLPPLYTLWENIWDYVPLDVLVERTYGVVDAHSRRSVLIVLSKLRNDYLAGSRAKFNHQGAIGANALQNGKVSFQLYEENQVPEPEDYQHPYLSFKYQDWQAQPDSGLLLRGDNQPKLKLGESLTTDQEHLVSGLKKYPGYILDYDYLSVIQYGKKDKLRALQAQLVGIRERLENPESIFTAWALGMAFGVEEFKLSRFQDQLLYYLWRQIGQTVPMAVLGRRVTGHYNRKIYFSLLRTVAAIRDALADSQYEIVTKIGPKLGQGAYGLYRRD